MPFTSLAKEFRSAPLFSDPTKQRMTTRLLNYWHTLRDGKRHPSRQGFSVETVPGLIDYGFTFIIDPNAEGPVYQFVGSKLTTLAGINLSHKPVDDTPDGSLMQEVAKQYTRVLERDGPVGFDAGFEDKWGRKYLFRTALLPFSEDGETIDCIVGAITYKELSSKTTSTSDWGLPAQQAALETAHGDDALEDEPRDAEAVVTATDVDDAADHDAGHIAAVPLEASESDTPIESREPSSDAQAPEETPDELEASLVECRELAASFQQSQGSSRVALYDTLERAYRFHFETLAHENRYQALCADAGIKLQKRDVFTGLVKLVFGPDQEKTRISEYATCLSYAKRLSREVGTVRELIESTEGGVKGCVKAERQARRQERPVKTDALEAAKAKLRKLGPITEITDQGDKQEEFVLLLARRYPEGGERLEVLCRLEEKPATVEAIVKRAAKALPA